MVEGSQTPVGIGQQRIQVLRGAPVEVYLLPRLQAPSGDPGAVVTFRSWRFLSGPNDHPAAPAAGADHGPLQPLRLRLDSRPPTSVGRFEVFLSASVHVVGSDGRSRTFQVPATLLVGVRYQAIA